MKLHYIQHVPFENMANIGVWAKNNGFEITGTEIFNNETFPENSDFDLLVIMGGPMSVYEEDKYPWLKDEKEFVKKTIEQNIKVIGVCLGAQLLADVLNANVYKGYKEIGWFKVRQTGALFDIEEEFTAFHWHGDTFDIPKNGIRLFSSEKTPNQGFLYNKNVLALQFHLEVTEERVSELIKNSGDDLVPPGRIQSPEEMLELTKKYQDNAAIILNTILDKFYFDG